MPDDRFSHVDSAGCFGRLLWRTIMAYDRYDPRDERAAMARMTASADAAGRDEDRGFFERAGDEVASWFGDDEAERRRREDLRTKKRRALRHGTVADHGRVDGRDLRPQRVRRKTIRRADLSAMYRAAFRRSHPSPASGYGRGSFAPSATCETRPRSSIRTTASWRQRQLDELDRDYDEYRRETSVAVRGRFRRLARTPADRSAACSARSASIWKWSAATTSMSAPSTARPATASS